MVAVAGEVLRCPLGEGCLHPQCANSAAAEEADRWDASNPPAVVEVAAAARSAGLTGRPLPWLAYHEQEPDWPELEHRKPHSEEPRVHHQVHA